MKIKFNPTTETIKFLETKIRIYTDEYFYAKTEFDLYCKKFFSNVETKIKLFIKK